MPPYAHLSAVAHNAYAQALDAALSASHFRSVAALSGAFAEKFVRGHRYWYFQYREPAGKLRQLYVGPDNEAVRKLIEGKTKQASSKALAPLSAAAIALGCAQVTPRQFRVLQRLEEYQFFKAGGVLIGTHAFVAYANMLGVQWGIDGTQKTLDIDFAHPGRNLTLAIAEEVQVQTHKAIETLEMGFLPITEIGGKTGGSYLIPNEPEFRLDFITTAGRGGSDPYEHPDLHVTLQPLKFIEYALEDLQQAAIISPGGIVVANVPHPARYALHKLIVYGERKGSFASKSHKDLDQSGFLLSVLKSDRAWEVEAAWEELVSRGEGWESRARCGISALSHKYPDLELEKCLKATNKTHIAPAPSALYGYIYTEEAQAGFLLAKGVRTGLYDAERQRFPARIPKRSIKELEEYPADFRIEAYDRNPSSSKTEVSDLPPENLRAEAAYLDFLLSSDLNNNEAAPQWKARLEKISEREASVINKACASESSSHTIDEP